MNELQLLRGRRYHKLVRVRHGDTEHREALAFYDTVTGHWLEAESWKSPRRRLIDPRVFGPVPVVGGSVTL